MPPPANAGRARSFGAVAGLYDRVRPGYPEDVAYWLVGEQPRRVLDLGAGTGKLTAAVTALGHDVVAVEPDEDMAAQLVRSVPGVEVLAGTAEAIPVPDGTIDVVVAGQAYHWFDRVRAIPEIARVLRPGGALGLVWNIRDTSSAWVRALDALLGEQPRSERIMERIPDCDSPWFGPYQRNELHHSVTLDAESLVELVASRSDAIVMAPDQRDALAERVRQLVATHPSLAGKTTFEMPYIAQTFRSVAFAMSPDWEP